MKSPYSRKARARFLLFSASLAALSFFGFSPANPFPKALADLSGSYSDIPPTYSCEQLKGIIQSGLYSADQKAQWGQCPQDVTTPQPAPSSIPCDQLKTIIGSGTFTPDQKDQYLKCQATDSSAGLQTPIQETPPPTPAIPQPPVNPVAESQSCKELRAEFAAAVGNAKTTPQDAPTLSATFAKQCATDPFPPPARYDDAVLANPDAYGNPFPDTSLNDIQGKAAAELYRRGVIGGFPDGQFKGENPVNRAEAAKFLLLACGKSTQADPIGTFRDVMKGQWYTPYVEAAAAQGVISGYPDGTFRPANRVNRAEFLKMITLACQLPTDLDHSRFTDVAATAWFAPYAGAAQQYSLFPNSLADNLLKPANPMTRSEVAIAIYQYLTNR